MISSGKHIDALVNLGKALHARKEEFSFVIEKSYQHNKWFTPDNIQLALSNISEKLLKEENILQWLSFYPEMKNAETKTIGIVMAGNIPLAGFHDFLSVILSGHKALIKLSSKDDVLFPFLLHKLFAFDPELEQYAAISGILKGMDAVIATGSNNSSRYFEYYFGKYPHIIRKNRSSVAVITGNESEHELHELGEDIFSYFGLGCRNVSKLLIPDQYNPEEFLSNLEAFNWLNAHNKYMNNYDYNRTLLLLNQTKHSANDFVMLKEDALVASPIALLHYERYSSEKELQSILQRDKNQIQCVAGNNFTPFGRAQSPELWDYPDEVDTMKFLMLLN